MAERLYFGTDGIRGVVGQNPIHPEFVLKLGWAVGEIIREQHPQKPKVLIGKDTRISGYMLESALEAGFSAAGVDVWLLGPMPTPAIAYLTKAFHAQMGVVISASHNRFEDNGIKFFSDQGGKLPDSMEERIENKLQETLTLVANGDLGKARRISDAPGRYIEFCKGTVSSSLDLSGLKIVLDCSNGATYHVAPEIFKELGAEVIELGIDPDGVNINDGCGSTYPNLIQKTVKLTQSHVGIALDGDGDRVILCDENGDIIDGDEILYILAKDQLSNGKLPGGVVGTVMSNLGLEWALQSIHKPLVRTKVGDRYVLEKLKELGWYIGGETSGHIVCLHKTSTGDGLVTALQILQTMKNQEKTLSELRDGFIKFPQILTNVHVKKFDIQLLKEGRLYDKIQWIESRLSNEGRVLIRPSGTEPVVRVMVEGKDPQLVKELSLELTQAVQEIAG